MSALASVLSHRMQ